MRQKGADPPQPLQVDGDKEYEVEEVLGSQMHWQQLQYLVKWIRYGVEHNKWVSYQDMHADNLIEEFHKKNLNVI